MYRSHIGSNRIQPTGTIPADPTHSTLEGCSTGVLEECRHPSSANPSTPEAAEPRSTGKGTRQSSRRRTTVGIVVPVLAACLLGTAHEARGQDPDASRWTNAAELTFLLTGGNSGASTLGIRNDFRWITPRGELRITGLALRTDATEITRVAEGSGPDDFVVRETTQTERSAERYAAGTRYDLNLSERFFAYGSVGWTRNTFAGFENRTVSSLGAGNQWGPGEEAWSLRLGYGLTYTTQEDVAPDPGGADGFAGARVTVDHIHQLTDGTTAELEWVIDANTERSEDLRGDFTQSIAASLNDHLSFNTTLQVLWANDPPLERVPLVSGEGQPLDEQVLVPLDSFDYSLSVALVVTL